MSDKTVYFEGPEPTADRPPAEKYGDVYEWKASVFHIRPDGSQVVFIRAGGKTSKALFDELKPRIDECLKARKAAAGGAEDKALKGGKENKAK
jgi:hypothetical protein